MIKIKENKIRKRLRITQCVLYLVQIFWCTWTFVAIPKSDGNYFYATVFDMFGYIGGEFPEGTASGAFQAYVPFYFIFLLIPIVGFFFCALDKERNLKNVVSIICCLLGVISILTIVTINFSSIGSKLSIIFYVIISFISIICNAGKIKRQRA